MQHCTAPGRVFSAMKAMRAMRKSGSKKRSERIRRLSESTRARDKVLLLRQRLFRRGRASVDKKKNRVAATLWKGFAVAVKAGPKKKTKDIKVAKAATGLMPKSRTPSVVSEASSSTPPAKADGKNVGNRKGSINTWHAPPRPTARAAPTPRPTRSLPIARSEANAYL